MIRFILKRRTHDAYSGLQAGNFETVDFDIPGLEAILMTGGSGPSGYEIIELHGIEVLPAPENKP